VAAGLLGWLARRDVRQGSTPYKNLDCRAYRPAVGSLAPMPGRPILECVINISEGADTALIHLLAEVAGPSLLDVHSDIHHNRSVFTLAGTEVEADAQRLAAAAIQCTDIRNHQGVHPRFGVVDVVPFIPFTAADMPRALAARDRFARWLAATFDVPCFIYGPDRTLPQIRKNAFRSLSPDFGPERPHLTAGASAIGARNFLIAYNLWVTGVSMEQARKVASLVRAPSVRALALTLDDHIQISCNLVAPTAGGLTPAEIYDEVAQYCLIERAELVGLIPAAILEATPGRRRHELDLSEEKTIENRLAG
jgi:glutamate formiminotransferase / 5-formyltetrahydrofolate cyclo-ligase